MFKVSDLLTTPPADFESPLQRKVYVTFAALGIPFERVDTDPGLTMEDCRHIDATTILSAILPECAPVHLVMDDAIARSDQFACTDGTPTCFVKLRTADLLTKYLPASGHILTVI